MISNRRIRILWLGNVVSEELMLSSRGVSPAANRWQAGLLQAITEAGCHVRILGHKPEPVWPRGPLRISTLENEFSFQSTLARQSQIGYWNVPFLRDQCEPHLYRQAFCRLLKTEAQPDCILSYNIFPHSLAIAEEATRLRIPWIPIIADAPADQIQLKRNLQLATGCVFLSWGLFSKITSTPKLHLDGGVVELRFSPDKPETFLPCSPPTIFYSGSVVLKFGLANLIDAFRRLSEPDLQLLICGKGAPSEVLVAASEDARIKLMGCVPEEELIRHAQAASVMVNPRPNLAEHENNFPSKVLEYLSYGKPVVSTWTPGLHPDYRKLLSVVEDGTPAGIANSLKEAVLCGNSSRATHAMKCAEFLSQTKLWEQQAKRLINWITTLTET